MKTPDNARTRRRFLAGGAVAGLVGVAGCGGMSGDSESPEGTTASDDSPADSGVSTDESVATTASDSGHLSAPTLGPDDASVTVLAFEDYACPHCREFSLEVFPEIETQYVDTGEIRYEFHDFPIPVNVESERAANAARAVQDTVGEDAYWTYSKLLFENQPSLGPSKYADLAGEVDADPDTVRTAAVEKQYADTVQADRSDGVDRGVQGTPAIFVDGGSPLDRYSYETVSSAIEDAL
jgi:protein-disulfide isomerase